jgi:Flp pilus assembly protein CpaB
VSARRLLLLVAAVAGVFAALLYLAALPRVGVLVAARDLDGHGSLERADIEVRRLPPDAVPAGTLSDPALVVGRSLRGPLVRGQFVMSSILVDRAAIFQNGLLPPEGTRAVAVPVTAANAIGGAVVPGTYVDVVAVPVAGRAPEDRGTELLASAALVLDVRSEAGAPYARATTRPGLVSPERIGSVVIAVPQPDQLLVADRIGTSTFVLILAAPP